MIRTVIVRFRTSSSTRPSATAFLHDLLSPASVAPTHRNFTLGCDVWFCTSGVRLVSVGVNVSAAWLPRTRSLSPVPSSYPAVGSFTHSIICPFNHNRLVINYLWLLSIYHYLISHHLLLLLLHEQIVFCNSLSPTPIRYIKLLSIFFLSYFSLELLSNTVHCSSLPPQISLRRRKPSTRCVSRSPAVHLHTHSYS